MENHFRNLILAYDRAADEREKFKAADWKQDLRWKFLNILKAEGKSRLIDIGAGTGIHAKFFQEQGIDVTCVDLSPAHIEKCIEKGLKSYVLNVLDLDNIDHVFDSAFSFNSLLHIPTSLLPNALSNISKILEPNGLLYWGQYGGEYSEGIYQEDNHDPKRFFSLLNDEQIQEMASEKYTVEEFEIVYMENTSPLYFQSMLLRVKLKS